MESNAETETEKKTTGMSPKRIATCHQRNRCKELYKFIYSKEVIFCNYCKFLMLFVNDSFQNWQGRNCVS